MKYCVVKNISNNMTTGTIAHGEDETSLIQQALRTEVNGKTLTADDILILDESEYQTRLDNQPSIEPLSEIEILKMEQAKANSEMINLMMSMLGGAM